MAEDILRTIIMQDELSPEERAENQNAAAGSQLQVGRYYRFNRPVVTVPVSERERGTRETWIKIIIQQGMYLRWDQRYQWHLFSVDDHGVQRRCPVFFVHGLSVKSIK